MRQITNEGYFFCNFSLVICLILDTMKSFSKKVIKSKLVNKWTPYLFCKQTWPKSLYISIGQSAELIWSKVIVKQIKYTWLVICLIFETVKKKYPSLVICLIFDTMKIIGVLAYITFDQINISPLPTLIYRLIDHAYLQNKYGAHILNIFESIIISGKLFNVSNMTQITNEEYFVIFW